MNSLILNAAPVNYNNTCIDEYKKSFSSNKSKTYKNKIKNQMVKDAYDTPSEEKNINHIEFDENEYENETNNLADFDNSNHSNLSYKNKNSPIFNNSTHEINNISEINNLPDYHKQYIDNQNNNILNNQSNHSVNNYTILLQKLDNILHILEEQQEQKTNYIFEELILYLFLGIFIIYVLDSFVKVGKYTR